MDNFLIERERSRSKKERFQNFEHTLRYLLCDLKNPTDRDDSFLLDNVKQTIILFGMKDNYEEDNKIFLENMQYIFNASIEKLEIKHPDISERTLYIKLFMEDFYFNR